MQLFFRSFLIFVLGVAAFVQVQAQSVCPNIVLSRCNQNVIFDWSHTPAGSLNPQTCAVGQGGNNSVGSTCASVGTTVTAPVATGTYAFGARTTADSPVSSNTCTVSYQLGIDCNNQCRDGFDNDGDGQVDASDTTGAGSVANAGCACPNATSESATCGGGTYLISALPNPVQICSPATTGITNISWTAPATQSIDIDVNGTRTHGPVTGSGSISRDWIRVGQDYNFVLRKTGSNVSEATVAVTGTTTDCPTTKYQCTGVAGSACGTCTEGGTNPTCGSNTFTTQALCESNANNQCGAATPRCGDGTIDPDEQCDNGDNPITGNGTAGNTCNSSCQTVSVPTQINIGFDASYTKIKSTPALANETVYVTTGGRTGCSVSGDFKTENTVGINMPVPPAVVGIPSHVMLPQYDVVNRPVGTYPYRLTCPGVAQSVTATLTVTAAPPAGTITGTLILNASAPVNSQCDVTGSATTSISPSGSTTTIAQIRSTSTTGQIITQQDIGVPLTISSRFIAIGQSYTAVLGLAPNSGANMTQLVSKTVTCAAGAPMNIGWGPTYSPTSESVTVPSGGASNLPLYVTTGGRSGCRLDGQILANQTAIAPVLSTPTSYAIKAPVSANPYTYTLTCGATSVTATLTVTSATTKYQCATGSTQFSVCSPCTEGGANPTCAVGVTTYASDDACASATVCSPRTSCGNTVVDRPSEQCDASATSPGCLSSQYCNSVCQCITPPRDGYAITCPAGVICNGVNSASNTTPTCQVVQGGGQYASLSDCQTALVSAVNDLNYCVNKTTSINVQASTPVDSGVGDGTFRTNITTTIVRLGFIDDNNAVLKTYGRVFACMFPGQSYDSATCPDSGQNLYNAGPQSVISNPFILSENPTFMGGISQVYSNGTYGAVYMCPVTVSANTPMSIGWGPAPAYTPTSESVTVPSGGASNLPLYVTTGGRSGCTLSGYMESVNQSGINMSPSSPSHGMFPFYTVKAPVSANPYTYRLSCPGVTQPVIATLTVTAAPPLSSGWQCAGAAGSACSACGGSSGVPCVGGTPFGSQASCESSLSNQCGPVDKYGATCTDVVVNNSQPVMHNTPFNIAATFRNSGNVSWSPVIQFKAITSSAVSPWNNLINTLGISTAANESNIFTFSLPAVSIAPGIQSETRDVQVRMQRNGSNLGNACEVTKITIRNPQCNDGDNNDLTEDLLIDCLDPGCWTGGVVGAVGQSCVKTRDTERDPVPGVVLKISANPQLVRQGGSSVVSYEVNECKDPITNKSLAWNIQEGAVTVASGSGTSGGLQQVPSQYTTNIQSKKTFVLSCGGTSRSATISVIKINEF